MLKFKSIQRKVNKLLRSIAYNLFLLTFRIIKD